MFPHKGLANVQMTVVSPCPAWFSVRIWAVCLRFGDRTRFLTGSLLPGPNDLVEFIAVQQGLALLNKRCHVSVFVDEDIMENLQRSRSLRGVSLRSKLNHQVYYFASGSDCQDKQIATQLVCDSAPEISSLWSIFALEESVQRGGEIPVDDREPVFENFSTDMSTSLLFSSPD